MRELLPGIASESRLIVDQAATRGQRKRIWYDWLESGLVRLDRGGTSALSKPEQTTRIMEALPMIARKNVAGGMEFLITVGVSAVAGLLAFLLVSVVVNALGLFGG